MKIQLLSLAAIIAALPCHAQQPAAPDAPPFTLRVMVRFSYEKDNPTQAAYLYRKLREVPNVTLVREEPEYFLDVNTLTGKNGVSIMQFVVMQPATPVIRDVVSDRVEARLKMQNVSAWQEVGNLIREETQRVPGAFFYLGMVGYTSRNADAVVDGAVKSFEATYVEPARLRDRTEKDHLRALDEQVATAKTPEEKRAAAAALAKHFGLPMPKPLSKTDTP